MAIGDIIVGIDIGTSKTSCVVGEVNNFNQIEVICTTSCKNKGLKKGKIIDEDDIVNSVIKVIHDAETEADLKINSAYVCISGRHITIVQNSIVREAKDKYAGISIKDVTASLGQVKDIDIPEGKTIIDIVAEQFILEDGKVTSDPVGCLSASFTLNAQVVLANKDYLIQLKNIFKKANVEIDGMVPTTLAERNLVLDVNEINDNIMLLDIGAGNTEIGIFEGPSFVYTNTIPVGGDNITNDIAYVLDISVEEAERLKKQYGLAMKSYIDNDHDIMLNTCKDETRSKVIKSSELIEIIEARIEEIFSLVNKDIVSQGIKQKINNVILTGEGISTINKSDVAGKIILNIPVKIATGRFISTVRPSYRTAYSLIRYVAARPFTKKVSSNIDAGAEDGIIRRVLEKIRDFFYS